MVIVRYREMKSDQLCDEWLWRSVDLVHCEAWRCFALRLHQLLILILSTDLTTRRWVNSIVHPYIQPI